MKTVRTLLPSAERSAGARWEVEEGDLDSRRPRYGLLVVSAGAVVLSLFLLIVVVQPVVGYLSEHLHLLPPLSFGWALPKAALLGAGLLLTLPLVGLALKRRLVFASGLLFLWVVMIQVAHMPWIMNRFPEEAALVLGNTLLNSAAMWLVGVNVRTVFELSTRSRLMRTILFSLYGLFAATLSLGIATGFSRYGALFGAYRDPAAGLSYIEIADAFAISTFWILAAVKSRFMKASVMLLGAGLLFFALSRSSFFIFLFTLAVVLFSRLRRTWFRAGVLVTVLGVLVLTSATLETLRLPETAWAPRRVLQILTAPWNDPSVQERFQHLEEGITRLSSHWVLGSFMAEVTMGGGRGTYIHNWLSFWEAYGIGPFLFFIGLAFGTLLGTKRLLSGVRRGQEGDLVLLVSSMALFCLASVIISRSYIWSYIWFPMAAVPVLDEVRDGRRKGERGKGEHRPDGRTSMHPAGGVP